MFRALDIDGPFGRFARRVLAVELPELPDDRLDQTVSFVCQRAAQTPGPLRLGVTVLAVAVGGAERFVDRRRLTAWLRRTSLPFIGELARMVRSLGFAYVWETWPSSTATGAIGATDPEVAA